MLSDMFGCDTINRCWNHSQSMLLLQNRWGAEDFSGCRFEIDIIQYVTSCFAKLRQTMTKMAAKQVLYVFLFSVVEMLLILYF